MRKPLYSVLVAVTAILSFGLAEIQAAPGGNFGVRGGYDFDAEQAVIGFQAELGKLIELARFAPSADYGFGNDLTTFAFNGDIRIYISPPQAAATFYGSVGPTFFVIDSDGRDADSEFGLTLSGGVKFGAGKGRFYNLEGRFGMDDMPDFRLLFGIYF
ncbi:MAG: hypothetical protein ACREBV_02985 [Candidatus Zixiibacteriota bacterium]